MIIITKIKILWGWLIKYQLPVETRISFIIDLGNVITRIQ